MRLQTHRDFFFIISDKAAFKVFFQTHFPLGLRSIKSLKVEFQVGLNLALACRRNRKIEKNVSNIPNCFIFAPNYKNQLDEKITECIGFNSFNLCWNY